LFCNLSWSLSPAKAYILHGRNATGKTSLLKMAATLLLPDSGEVSVTSLSSRQDPIGVRQKMTYLAPHEGTFYGNLNGWQNLTFFGRIQNIPAKYLIPAMMKLADLFSLSEHLKLPVEKYSSGMKQKLSLIRTFALNRPLILLDEPDRFLDDASVQILKNLCIEQVQKGHTVLLTTALANATFEGSHFTLLNGTVAQGV